MIQENKIYKGVPYIKRTRYVQETMDLGFEWTSCECNINGKTKIGSERQIKLFITKNK